MNKAEKSLRWVVNQIPDPTPKTNEEKRLLAIKLYSEAGAEEIKRLEAENAALRARLDKVAELPCAKMVKTNEWIDRVEIGDIIWEWVVIYIDRQGEFVVEPCVSRYAAEARLAELKGGRNDE